ncbi:unnamed protein product [Linum trigynum]|uniref:Uncharacterized protein n=1 Tax=Linum trigynum TaxID=586398 RepID=A0AAV2G8P9_9ROSI
MSHAEPVAQCSPSNITHIETLVNVPVQLVMIGKRKLTPPSSQRTGMTLSTLADGSQRGPIMAYLNKNQKSKSKTVPAQPTQEKGRKIVLGRKMLLGTHKQHRLE